MTKPLVSILIRSTDRPTLQRTLDSIATQTWPAIEVVVVAASGHGHRMLPDRCGAYPMTLVFAEADARLSRPDAANLALAHVRGEWFNFLDDDDEFLPHHVEALVTASGAAARRVRYSRTEVRGPDGRVTGHSGRAGVHAQFYFQARGTFIATMFHRSLIDEGARFDPAFLSLQDRDFMVNCASRTPFGFVDAVTCVWHAHIGGSGSGHGANQHDESTRRYEALLRTKWAALFDRWLSEPQALLFFGQHLLGEGKPAEALPYLEQAVRDAPNDVNALNLCGMAYLRSGKPALAEPLLAKAVRLLPAHAELQENLALVRRELPRP